MDSLPPELINTIARMSLYEDLLSLRLTSKTFCSAATKPLFSHIHGSPETSTHLSFCSTIASPELSRMVDSVKITTYSGPDKSLEEYRNEEEESQLSESFIGCLKAVNSFPNLQTVQLEFAQVCSRTTPDPARMYLHQAEQSIDFRCRVLSTLFSSLNSQDQGVARLHSVSIKNLQNYNVKSFVDSEDFLSVLSKIKELRLRIVMEYDRWDPPASWRLPEMHHFFAEFPKIWLKPASANLESLTIHTEHYWGYIPKCDLRSVHFPKLRKLELGNFSFSHDWQLDWILSHRETLEELILDDCLIVAYSQNYGPSDAENYPVNPGTDSGNPCVWEYARTWAHYFSAFQEKLPRLKVFKFGGGDWGEGANFDSTTQWTHGLKSESYMAFNRDIGPHPWATASDHKYYLNEEELFEAASIVVEDKGEKHKSEDQAAYECLIASLRVRA